MKHLQQIELGSLNERIGFFGASRAVLAAAVAALPASAAASETINYVYDARGRLVEVERVQPTVTVKSKYTYDRADNRIKKEVTTTP